MKKYRIGYTCGVYDLLHVGHLNLFERCKEFCDVLVVGVCDDEYVRKTKGKTPVISDDERLRLVNSLRCVDAAYKINTEETIDKMVAWNKFHFDVLFSGDDWKDSERYRMTEQQFEPLGVKIEYLPYTHGVSTTEIKTKILDS